jgi:4-amino-4-deoxy-L-arabinose transferase-like glycosyltransferase
MSLPRLFIKATIPLASILLIFAGLIQLRAQFWTIGAICLVLAMVGFIFSVRLLERSPFTVDEIETLRPWAAPVLLWGVVISLLAISVLNVTDHFNSIETDRIAAAAWVLSVLLGLFIIWGKGLWSIDRTTLSEKIRANRNELILLGIVLAFAFAVRTIDLSSHPYPWSGDETSIGMEGARIIRGEITDFFGTGWSSQPNWSFVPTAITEMIFGKNIVAVRMTSVLAGTLAVLFVYLTARELFNPSIALMAATFLATLPFNVHFSRIGVNNIVDSFMSALLFWLLARAIKTDDPRYYYSAGLVGGLCFYTYAGTKLVLILASIVLLFLIVRQRDFLSSHWRHLVAFSVAVVVSAAPQAAFFAQHPNLFMVRLAQEGILFNGWLVQHAAETDQSVWELLFRQFTDTTMVFIASPASGFFFQSPVPYLTMFGSVLFLLGMAYALAYGLETRYFILLLWFWAVVLFGGILTMNPPANTRLLMTTPPIAILMALGAYKILEYLQKFRILPERVVPVIFVVIVGIITYQQVNFYMVEYKNKMYFASDGGEYAMELGLMAKERGKNFQIFVLGAPRIFSDFPTIAFLAPDNPRQNLTAEGIDALELPAGTAAGFFAISENRPMLDAISQKYPSGERGLVYRKPEPNEILFEYYILEP